MTTADEVMAAVQQDALSAERYALELLSELALINETLAPVEKRKKEVTESLKQYMALQGMDSLRDGEHGLTARFQDRKGTPVYDLVSLARDTDGLALIRAAEAGMARIDHPMLTRFRKDAGASWADVIHKYEMPGTGTSALVLERDTDKR